MILGSGLRVAEAIVPVAHKVNERRWPVGQVVGGGDVL